jgi:hypothetical protein
VALSTSARGAVAVLAALGSGAARAARAPEAPSSGQPGRAAPRLRARRPCRDRLFSTCALLALLGAAALVLVKGESFRK